MSSFLGHDKVAELLIEKGADINVVVQDGMTVLHWAADKGFEKLVAMLIEKGANVNAVNENGNSALILATLNGN